MYTKQIIFYGMAIAKRQSLNLFVCGYRSGLGLAWAIQRLTLIFLCALTSTVQDVLCVLTKRRSFCVITVLMTYS